MSSKFDELFVNVFRSNPSNGDAFQTVERTTLDAYDEETLGLKFPASVSNHSHLSATQVPARQIPTTATFQAPSLSSFASSGPALRAQFAQPQQIRSLPHYRASSPQQDFSTPPPPVVEQGVRVSTQVREAMQTPFGDMNSRDNASPSFQEQRPQEGPQRQQTQPPLPNFHQRSYVVPHMHQPPEQSPQRRAAWASPTMREPAVQSGAVNRPPSPVLAAAKRTHSPRNHPDDTRTGDRPAIGGTLSPRERQNVRERQRHAVRTRVAQQRQAQPRLSHRDAGTFGHVSNLPPARPQIEAATFELQENLHKATTRMTTLNTKLTELSRTHWQLQQEGERLRREIREAEEERDAVRKQFQTICENMRRAMDELTSSVEQKQQELQIARAENERLRSSGLLGVALHGPSHPKFAPGPAAFAPPREFPAEFAPEERGGSSWTPPHY